jgi:hypothetical protein
VVVVTLQRDAGGRWQIGNVIPAWRAPDPSVPPDTTHHLFGFTFNLGWWNPGCR